MRTRTLVFAAIAAACAIPAMAQNNVYSLNVVGYINAPLQANRFDMLVNQLNAMPDNNITNVLTQAFPDGTLVTTFANGQWSSASEQYIQDFGWYPGETMLDPGQGFAILAPADFTATFVGEVPQGTSTVSLQAGYNLVGSVTPQALPLGDATTDPAATLTFPAEDGDIYTPWDPNVGTAGGYGGAIQYIGGFGWYDDANPSMPVTGPSPAVGASFFMFKTAAADWTRTFNVQ